MNLGRPRIWTQIHKSQPPEYSLSLWWCSWLIANPSKNVQAPDLITKRALASQQQDGSGNLNGHSSIKQDLYDFRMNLAKGIKQFCIHHEINYGEIVQLVITRTFLWEEKCPCFTGKYFLQHYKIRGFPKVACQICQIWQICWIHYKKLNHHKWTNSFLGCIDILLIILIFILSRNTKLWMHWKFHFNVLC